MIEIKLTGGKTIKGVVQRINCVKLMGDNTVTLVFPDNTGASGRLMDHTEIPGGEALNLDTLSDRDVVMMGLGAYLATRDKEASE